MNDQAADGRDGQTDDQSAEAETTDAVAAEGQPAAEQEPAGDSDDQLRTDVYFPIAD